MSRKLPPDQVIYYFLHDLGEILEYTEFQERWLEEESRRYNAHIHSDEDEDWERYGNRRNLAAALTMTFPQLGRHSLVVYVYSLLEDSLNQFCQSLKKEWKLEAELGKAKGKGIKRAKDYIVKNTNISFPSGSNEWQRACNMGLLRDKLVHALGHLEKPEDDHLRQVTKGTPGLSTKIYAREEIQVESFYVEESCRDLERLARKLLVAYEETERSPSNS